ncbi:E3 ubiquitin-protein ligase BOI isoform X1 [Abrus precatorius]|uniref:E3 ubiquitin-protein ligase BOI isoform X1 n=2 Tax=Abrus precatorius TaxID=3816 RepID=A0A8B8M0L3_ABRPR|nr:E3 ubiquitin-protein ligase BOI isoform X1 [Abrus precatorius]
MLGSNSGNRFLPVFLDETQFRPQTNGSNQLQLFGNLQAGCGVDPVNYFGNEHISSMIHPNKRSREMEDISKQRLQISLNYNVCQDDVDRLASIPNPNPVSTGLRLSYDDDERNSSVTSASGSMTVTPSIILSLGDNIKTELDRQQEELDQYIKLQKEQLSKGVRDMKQKHMASLLTSIEKGISKKLKEKDVEIENMNRKNRELAERIKQVAIEAQSWHYRAKYNESVVNALKNNLQQAISLGVEQGKEGFGDSEVDDTASYIDPNNFLSIPGVPINSNYKNCQGMENLTCRACKAKEVSMLLMPCRHLCLCKDCDGLINVCPVCQLIKTGSVEVYLS